MLAKLLIPLALVILAVSAAPALAIDGGVPDGNGHPNVGVLAWDPDGPGPTPPFAICTGSVISDQAFLTAAHCIEAVPATVQWVITLAPGSPENPLLPGGYYPSEYPLCCSLMIDESQLAHAIGADIEPGYDPTSGIHDLAVVVFPPGTFDVAPVDLPRLGALDHFAAAGNREGPQFTLVGYGTEVRDDGFYAAGYRKAARASFYDLDGNWLQLRNEVDDLPRSGALCPGDSGSPQFLAGTNTQVSVHHQAAPPCGGTGYEQRLDTLAEQQFLADYVTAG